MRIGMVFPTTWKMQSEKQGISLSDILYGYAIETLMLRIEKSSLQERLWLTNEECLGEEAYRKNIKDRLSFFYAESKYKPFQIQDFAKEVLQTDLDDIIWTYYIEETGTRFVVNLEGHYQEMRVPVVLVIEAAPENAQNPKAREFEILYAGKKTCHYLSYSKESALAEQLFEILRKLELIGDMETYYVANQILKNYSISGRHMIEDFRVLGEKEPKVVSLRRLEQIENYKSYAYMRKKWEQYEKRHGREPEDWAQVLERILKFLKPIWKAFCENEIFFDDWMPELGRFLG